MRDEITIYTSTRNAATAKDEHIRMYLSGVYFQSTRGVKNVNFGSVTNNNYVCLIPYKFVDAHGKIYMPFYDWELQTIEDRREKYWTLKTSAKVFIGLIDEPEIIPNAQYTSITQLQTKYSGNSFNLANFDDYVEGSPEIWHAAIGGV